MHSQSNSIIHHTSPLRLKCFFGPCCCFAVMPSQLRKDLGQGWVEMQDVSGRIYYANKQTKERSWRKPFLNGHLPAEPEASVTAQPSISISTDRQGSFMDSTDLASVAAVSSAPVPASKRQPGHSPRRRHPPKQIPAAASSSGMRSENSSSDAIHTHATMKVTAPPPRGAKGRLQLAAVGENELESSPFQPAEISDDGSFIDDAPTSFARPRNANTFAKPLALMLEDALAAQSDDISEHQQLIAIRKYFQELDHLSERSSQCLVESGTSSKVPSVSNQVPRSDDVLSIAATPREAIPSDVTNTFFTNEANTNSASIEHQTLASPRLPSRDHYVLRDVHVSGATGCFADFVNGVYEPTLEHCCGMTVYQKRGDSDKWLEYSNDADRWSIVDTAHRGQVWGWAYLTTHRNIEKCTGLSGWKIADGSRHVDDLNIRCHIVERSAVPAASETMHSLRSSNILIRPPASARGSSLFPNTFDPLNSARSGASVLNVSSPRLTSEVSKALPPFHALSIIEELERTLVKHRVAAEASRSWIQNAIADNTVDSYRRLSLAIIRLQARFRGQRVRKTIRQQRLSTLVHDLSIPDDSAPAQGSNPENTPQRGTSARMFGAADAVDVDNSVFAYENEVQSNHRSSHKRQSVALNPDNHVASVFHPVHNTSSKSRSAIDAIVRTGVHSDDIDPNQLLLILKKSKLFKQRKVADKMLPNASICCELVDFAVITFKLESRERAVQLFQKLVDSKHLKLPYTPNVFKDEHSLVILPRQENDQKARAGTSLNLNADFSVVVESIWRDNNMRIACSIVTDVMNNRDPRTSYEGWRSTLHDIAYSKGLRALLFLILLVHIGLGFFMAREINWTGSCRDHPSEVNRVRVILFIESGFCAVYILYMTMRVLAGFPKSLRVWFFLESALILIMLADVGYSHGTFDNHSVPVRFSLPLRALMITCWSHRLRTHLHEIYLSVRKLKVLGGAVLLWIIITATLITIYVRVVCDSITTENTCSQLTNIYFDNAATAMVTLAIMMTTSNYGTISQLFLNRPGQSTTGIIFVFIGLIIYMVISYFLLLSMMLAIVFDAFKKGKKEIMSQKADMFDAALIGAFSLLCERDSMSIKHDTYRRFMRMLIPNISSDRLKKYWEFLDADKNGSIALEEFLELSTIVSFQVHSVSLTRIKLNRFFASLGRLGTGLSFFNGIITSKWFIYIAEGIVVANILSVFVSNVLDVPPQNYVHPLLGYNESLRVCHALGSQASRNSCHGQIALDLIEFAFFIFYSLELILRWFAKGFQWVMDPWIIFDTAIVFVATASYVVLFLFQSNAIDPSISVVFRMMRIIRIVRLFRMSPNLNAFIVTISSIIPGVLSFLCLVLIFVNCYAGLGMLIFQCIDVNPDAALSNNVADFDTMTGSFIVLFQVLVTADWDSYLWQIRILNPSYFAGSAVYFLSFYIFIVLLLTNILVSLIIESYGVNLEIIRSGLVNEAVHTQDEGMLLMRYNQSKIIDAKIASFDRQAHRQSSHTFQSHKESLKLMQMKSNPSVPNDLVRRSRAVSNAVLATSRLRRATVESSTPQFNSLPDADADEPPKLSLNSSPQRESLSQLGNTQGITPEHSIIDDSSAFPRPRGISLNSESRPLSSKSAVSDIYTARWKISASGILDLLLNDSGLIKDIKHRFSQHNNVIVGSDLVTYFVEKRLCQNRQDAVDLGQHLLLDDILQHEYQEHVFKDKYLFYIISPGAAHNAANVDAGSDESDFEFDQLLVAHDESRTASQNATSRHSALTQHLIRRLSMTGNNDYLRDPRLQDEVIATAATDRYLQDDTPPSPPNEDSIMLDQTPEKSDQPQQTESQDELAPRFSSDQMPVDRPDDDSDEEFNRVIAASVSVQRKSVPRRRSVAKLVGISPISTVDRLIHSQATPGS